MYYLFSPLLDDKGERVVREEQDNDWIEEEDRPFYVDEYPVCGKLSRILTLQKFEQDPLKELREVYEKFNAPYYKTNSVPYTLLWNAIVKVVERVK